MGDENSNRNVNIETNMAASNNQYAMALKSTPNEAENDNNLTGVKPVFIIEKDIFGNMKPDPKDFLTHTELYKVIGERIDASHLQGLQRVRGLWRIYPDSEDDRNILLTEGRGVYI